MSEYVYREYPKWLEGKVIVNDADAEAAYWAAQEAPKRRGRPPGSKNQPDDPADADA